MENKSIGILAGMGPRSTAPFIDTVITECQLQYGAKYDDEFPHILIYSLPTPMRLYRPLNHDLLKESIINGLRKLEQNNVNFVAMPCNLAHMYYEDLSAAIDVPLINMIEEAVNAIPISIKKAALVAANPTAASGLYQRAGEKRSIEIITNAKHQNDIDELVFTVKTSGDREVSEKMWSTVISSILDDGIDTILLACTDLNTVAASAKDKVNLIDASDALAKSVVKEYLK